MDRRVGLVVSLAGSRLAENTRVICRFVQQVSTEGSKSRIAALPIYEISQIQARLEDLRLRSRVGYEGVLVEFLSYFHGRVWS